MRSVVLCFLFICFHVLAHAQQECQSTTYMAILAGQNPTIKDRLAAVENFTKLWIASRQSNSSQIQNNTSNGALIRIPVVVHIIYNSSAENISDAQVISQIDALNKDYRHQNADASNTPDIFKSFAADCEIQFILARTDPFGNPTNGIVRRQTNYQAFNIDDRIKSTAMGGDDPWNAENYLNIWVANLSSGILGFSSVPGAPKETDGVTIQYTAFGTMGTALAPFNKGRTTTHEIGHWLNLIHVWGDKDCGDDHVDDTPPQKGPNRGCPGQVRKTCANSTIGDMYMNFMDFTDDACMNLFTKGQRERMRSLFDAGGARSGLLNSAAANAIAGTPAIVMTPLPDLVGTDLKVYPNPATSMVYIQISDSMETPLELGVYNTMGQKLMSFRMNQHLQQVNVSSLGKGVYYIKSENGKQQNVARLVKM